MRAFLVAMFASLLEGRPRSPLRSDEGRKEDPGAAGPVDPYGCLLFSSEDASVSVADEVDSPSSDPSDSAPVAPWSPRGFLPDCFSGGARGKTLRGEPGPLDDGCASPAIDELGLFEPGADPTDPWDDEQEDRPPNDIEQDGEALSEVFLDDDVLSRRQRTWLDRWDGPCTWANQVVDFPGPGYAYRA